MANIVEFVIKMRDLVSGGMNRVASNSQRGFRSVTETVRRTRMSVQQLDERMSSLSRTVRISVDRSQIRQANREIQRLTRQRDRLLGGGNNGTSGGGLLGGAGGFARNILGAVGIAGAIAMGGTVLKQGMDAGARQASFEVMAGSKREGTALNQDLTKFAQDSIYGNELYKNAQTMLGFGMSAKSVMPNLQMIGDVAMGDAQKLNSLSLAFSQVQAAGKLTGQDLLQFINAGFNPLQEMSAATGKSIGQLKEDISKSAISADMVTAAFKRATSEGGRFFNMTNKISETPFGKWQALQGQVEGLAMKLGLALAPALGDLISNYLVPFVDWLSITAGWLQQNWDWISLVVGVIGTAVVAYRGVILAIRAWTAAQLLLNVAMSLNPVGLIIAGVLALVAAIVIAWNKFAGFRGAVLGVWEVLKGLGTLVKDFVVDSIKSLISGIAGVGETIALMFQGKWKQAYETGKKAVGDLSMSTSVKHAVDNASMLGDAWKTGYAKGAGAPVVKLPASLAGYANGGEVGNANDSLASLGGSTDSVTGGGSRTITINIAKFFDNINFYTDTTEQGASDMADLVTEHLTRVVYSAASVTGDN